MCEAPPTRDSYSRVRASGSNYSFKSFVLPADLAMRRRGWTKAARSTSVKIELDAHLRWCVRRFGKAAPGDFLIKAASVLRGMGGMPPWRYKTVATPHGTAVSELSTEALEWAFALATVLKERVGKDERALADGVWRLCSMALSKSRARKGEPKPPAYPPPRHILNRAR